MAKAQKIHVQYVCQECGASSWQWIGRCTTCGAWNSLVEERIAPERPTEAPRRRGKGSRGVAKAVPLSKVRAEDARRLPTGLGELDRVMGGGPVAGGVALLAGDPGIGKSTLLMQVLAGHARQGY